MEKEECCGGEGNLKREFKDFLKIQKRRAERKVHKNFVHFFVFYSEEKSNGY